MKLRNKKERTWLLLGVVEEKVLCRYVGEHSQRQEHLGESRVGMIRLSYVMWKECRVERE